MRGGWRCKSSEVDNVTTPTVREYVHTPAKKQRKEGKEQCSKRRRKIFKRRAISRMATATIRTSNGEQPYNGAIMTADELS